MRGIFALLGAAALWLAAGLPAGAQTHAPADPCNGLGVQDISIAYVMPVSLSATVQTPPDCMSWQTFISLNWRADPKKPGYPDPSATEAEFGAPSDLAPKVWESFADSANVFNPKQKATAARWNAPRAAVLNLSRLSEFGHADLSLSGISQAGNGKWLTNQRGGLTFYDIRLNQDEYDFITDNVFNGDNLTTYAGQTACAQAGTSGKGGFNLPEGSGQDTDCAGKPATYGQNVGAIEVKAAWTVLPADHSLDYRYLTALATVTQPDGSTATETVGLVGLHIIHKVQGAQQFVWATFEQIDNDPDASAQTPYYTPPALPNNPNQKRSTAGYTYFNPSCDPRTDVYGCTQNQLPGTPCASPPQTGCDPYDAPMQITRVVPVDPIANGVTAYAWSLMPASSVFNYYRLINVQWPATSFYVKPGSKIPLSDGRITPSVSTGIVANTTMETFEQKTNTCTSCHTSAAVAQAKEKGLETIAGHKQLEVLIPPVNASPQYASDYSFLFEAETNH